MKVTTDSCLFGAWCADQLNREPAGCSKTASMLDIGTGTGLLSLMVAQKTTAQIDAVEIDREASIQAAENIAASPWKSRIQVLQTDLVQWETDKKYNCIFSNPPFYENDLRSDKPGKAAAHHDDTLTLVELFCFVKNQLAKDGLFFFLLPAKRESEAEGLLAGHGLFVLEKMRVKQSVKHAPFRLLLKVEKNGDVAPVESEMAIRDGHNNYTDAFVSLLKDYYLYL